MSELSEWLSLKGWWVRSAFVSFFAVTLTAAIIRGAFFDNHDKRLLWFLFAPIGFTAYLIYLCWKRPSPVEPGESTPVPLEPSEPLQPGPERKPLLLDRVAAASPQGPRSLYLSLPSLSLRLLAAAVAGGVASFRIGASTVLLLLALVALLTLVLSKKRVELDENGATVVPLLPFLPEHRVLWSSLGPFLQKRHGRFATLKAPLNSQPPTARAPKSGLSVGALYGLGWLEPPLRPSEFAELLESYRTGAPLTPPLPTFARRSNQREAASAKPIDSPVNDRAAAINIQFHWENGRVANPQENVPLSILGLGERPAPGTLIHYSGKRWRVEDSPPAVTEPAGSPAAELYLLFEVPE